MRVKWSCFTERYPALQLKFRSNAESKEVLRNWHFFALKQWLSQYWFNFMDTVNGIGISFSRNYVETQRETVASITCIFFHYSSSSNKHFMFIFINSLILFPILFAVVVNTVLLLPLPLGGELFFEDTFSKQILFYVQYCGDRNKFYEMIGCVTLTNIIFDMKNVNLIFQGIEFSLTIKQRMHWNEIYTFFLVIIISVAMITNNHVEMCHWLLIIFQFELFTY